MQNNIKCLDHGFVRLVDRMGDDSSVVQAARVSYGDGTTITREDAQLINYLYRHRHTTPFEMVEFKFHCKMPIFVARQWIRHRMASVNEYSARYSILDKEFYVPKAEHMAAQSKSNKQGRGDVVTPHEAAYIQKLLIEDADRAYANYEYMINNDKEGNYDPERSMLARELARMNLPVNFYTQWYWKIDLHNLLHFLALRMDNHAQYEIRVFANAIYELIKPHVPYSIEAFDEYHPHRKAQIFSGRELNLLGMLLNNPQYGLTVKAPEEFSPGEWNEFRNKVKKLASSRVAEATS